jgi:hypothetical protein
MEHDMRKINGTLAALVIGGALILGGHAPTLAQDATPIAPAPTECVVEPRTAEDVAAIWNAGDYVPDANISAGVLPIGAPATDDVVTAVNATLRQMIACSNANDFARQLALMTDDGTQFFAPEGEVPVDQLADYFEGLLATPVAVADYEVVFPLTDVIVLEDGRVGGLEPDDPSDGEGHAVYIIFAQENGVWLIDQITEIGDSATPTA